ncbi:unnamed protein product [Chironomus riparius]|uniref:C2H2-type domain-containing protein n=1 Tax=Chironomus riparius TaxID=315576 RepID=A0A9N9S9E3_9DIPT|nr:unnamed protein product [Chironomus riparius]
MKNINSEIKQNSTNMSESLGIFSQIQHSVNNFTQAYQQPEDNFMSNLTAFDQNVKYSPEDEEACNLSFDSTLSATEIENDLDDMEIEDFGEAEQLFEDAADFSELLTELTEEFPALDELLNAELGATDLTITEQFQLQNSQPFIPEVAKQEVIRQAESNTVFKSEFACSICDKDFTAYSSLTRHYKTQKHQRMEAKFQEQGAPNLSSSVQTQNFSSNQQVQMPVINFVQHPSIYQCKASNAEQNRINYINKIRESRNKTMDQNRMMSATPEKLFMIVEPNKVPKPEECVQRVQILDEFASFGYGGSFKQVNRLQEMLQEVPTYQATPKASSNATKTAIENSIKILSKLNTENSSKSPELTESSPKKQNSLKQLTLRDMAFNKPATTQKQLPIEATTEAESQSIIEDQNDFVFDVQDLMASFNPELELVSNNTESELAKYIQEDIVQLDLESQDEQPLYQIIITEDAHFTVNKLNVPETTKTGLAKKMTRKRQQRIQEDINSTSLTGYKCGFGSCTRSFSTQSNLRRHEHLHGSKKLHKCQVCGKEFMQKEYLKKHMVTH